MKKIRRSARIADMMQYLLAHPKQLLPLTFFAERYTTAKSSISEDLQIIREVMENAALGELETLAGAAGGVQYIPGISKEQARIWCQEWQTQLENRERLLPGGYVYMTDLLQHPNVVQKIGKIFSSLYQKQAVDYVMTIETKGIPLAFATAQYLNVPVIIVRRDTKVMEGSVVSINYVSGSSKRIQTMSLAKRSLTEQANVLIVDDFMKAGGTLKGMQELLREFQANLVGTCVFLESSSEKRLFTEVKSLLKLEYNEQHEEESIKVDLGTIFEEDLR